MAAPVSSDGDGESGSRSRLGPPDLDYEGPASNHEDMNGDDIPELAPITNRRKRRKGIPTRVTKAVVRDESSSDSDSSPPFLLPNSPARIAPSGSSDGTSSRNHTPPLQTSSTPPRSITPININRTSPSRASSSNNPISASSSSTNTQATNNISINENDAEDPLLCGTPMPGENGVISGALFGFSKLTSSITTTSQGTKRVKLVIYMCNFCSYKTSDNSAFWEHCMNHLFTCMHCPFKAFTRQQFVKHLEKEHPGQMPDEYVNIRDISILDMSMSAGVVLGGGSGSVSTKGLQMMKNMSSGVGGSSKTDKISQEALLPGKKSGSGKSGKSGGGGNKQQQQAAGTPAPPSAQKQTILKFRCETCAYTTTIFNDFMEHQSMHKPHAAANSSSPTSPVSGKLKSLLTSPTALDSYSQKQIKPAQIRTHAHLTSATVDATATSKSTTNSDSGNQAARESPVLKFKDSAKHARCPICNFLLQSLSELEAHIQRCHQSKLTVTGSTTMDGNSNDSEGYTWGCVYCGSKSETKLSVVSHIKAVHPGEKIRVWRWPNKSNSSMLNDSMGSPQQQQSFSYRNSDVDTTPDIVSPTKKRATKRKDRSAKGKSSSSKKKVIGKANKILSEASGSGHDPLSDAAVESNENADENAASLLLKQIVSSTIDCVYGSGPEEHASPVLSGGKKTQWKIPEGSSAKDIMSGKCAITVRKIPAAAAAPNASTTSPRAMRSLITGGLVTSPGGGNMKQQAEQLSPKAQAIFTSSSSSVKTSSTTTTASSKTGGKLQHTTSSSRERSRGMPELNLQPPLLTPSYLDMPPGSLDSSPVLAASDIKGERRSPSPELPAAANMKQENFTADFEAGEEDLTGEGSKDVDVEVRKESLKPSDYISYSEELRVHCCRHCKYQTKSYGHIIDHISTHTGMKTWSCSYCSYRSNRRHDLLRHVQKKHPGFKLKMIRNVPYSNKFNYPLKMSQRVSAARSMVAKKKSSHPSARKSTTAIPKHFKKSPLGKKLWGAAGSSSAPPPPVKPKSPTKVDKWQPPPTVEFWECPICFRRGTMDKLENHIPYVHPHKVRKRISKKEILAPTAFSQLRSAKAHDKRSLKVHLAPVETLVACHHVPALDQPYFNGVDRKLQQVPDIMTRYSLRAKEEDKLEQELTAQRNLEAVEERKWLANLEAEQSDDDCIQNVCIPDEEYQCQYCAHTHKSIYDMRKHLLWNHPNMLLKCIDLRAVRKSSLTPRVVHMCYRCVFYSVSPYDLLSHYSRNKGHGPESESESDSGAEEELPVLEPACLDLSNQSSRRDDDTLPALVKNEDIDKKVHSKFLSRPLVNVKPSRRQVAKKRITMTQKVAAVVFSHKNSMKFVEGTQLQCKYCKDFKLTDSAIMKDHLLTEHIGQPAIAIDIRSKELKRTSRLFFCPLLECNFLEYGPKHIINHLREGHPETHFESLIMQICPKDARLNSSVKETTDTPPKSSPKTTTRPRVAIDPEATTPKAPPKVVAALKDDTPKQSPRVVQSPRVSVDEESGGGGSGGGDASQTVEMEDSGVLTGGTMPKTNAELKINNRYWCILCDAHACSISKFKGHFLEKHIDSRPQVVDARARILRKKSRIYFCWNSSCDFTTFNLKEAELHEESKMCLDNYVDDFKTDDEQLSGMSSQGSKSPPTDVSTSNEGRPSRSASQMYQCLYCSWMTSSHVNMLSHMAAEHACSSGGYSEINTDFDQNGAVVMNVGGDRKNEEAEDEEEGEEVFAVSPEGDDLPPASPPQQADEERSKGSSADSSESDDEQ